MRHIVYCSLHFTGETREAKYMAKVVQPASGRLRFCTQVAKALALSTAPHGVTVGTLWARRLEDGAGILLWQLPGHVWCTARLHPGLRLIP